MAGGRPDTRRLQWYSSAGERIDVERFIYSVIEYLSYFEQ